MTKPEVVIENYRNVYDFYGQTDPDLATVNQRIRTNLDKFETVKVAVTDDTLTQIEQLVDDRVSFIFSANHLVFDDHNVIDACLARTAIRSVLQNTRTFAKDSYFRQSELRPTLDDNGAIPVFRSSDYSARQMIAPAQALIDMTVANMSCKNQHLLSFFEGTRNTTGDPRTIQRLGAGLGRIACGIHQYNDSVAIVSIGLSYDDPGDPSTARVAINPPLTSLAGTSSDIRKLAQADLQQAVDHSYSL